MERREPYLPIAEYALIGNRHTCALVARDGSVDWCCLPELDSASVYAAILDANRGGHWRVAPAGEATATRAYVGSSAVLETEFREESGVLRLRDFLPIRRGRGNETSHSTQAIVRSALCLEGEVELEVEWMPRPDYGRGDVVLSREGGVVWARSGENWFWLTGFPAHAEVSLEGAAARARVKLCAGAGLDLISGHGRTAAGALLTDAYLDETLEWWEEWASACHVPPGAECWREPIIRSAMVLKLLTDEKTGAIAAAPTTSLPEEIGGVRNWDYRFCWVRDSTLIARALVTVGLPEDGVALLRFLESATQQHHDPARVQVLYRLNGETCVAEYDLGHLDGYQDSRPVRVGNAAATQRQLDVYGELIQAAVDLLRIGATLTPSQWEWLRGVVSYVCDIWQQPDRGIWEVRGPEMNFTYSKLMCWVALDRGISLAEQFAAPPEELQRWHRERDAIRAAILDRGYDAERNTFIQSFESRALDASNLMIPLTGFLPAGDPRVQGTIDAILTGLTNNGLVCRYRTDETPDGVGGGEGSFGICTFWLVDALTLSGRFDEAHEIFEGMLRRANDLGLYPEEIDYEDGRFLGNYPQAFTHVGLMNSAYLLGSAREAEVEPPLLSSDISG
ncbi:MAG: glycoside hydrolase family 15 protein [Gemmatimonadetes bacterium]|nr:glycoside hydrolase family 15 protein [Gemmatimonadota bacterium]